MKTIIYFLGMWIGMLIGFYAGYNYYEYTHPIEPEILQEYYVLSKTNLHTGYFKYMLIDQTNYDSLVINLKKELIVGYGTLKLTK